MDVEYTRGTISLSDRETDEKIDQIKEKAFIALVNEIQLERRKITEAAGK